MENKLRITNILTVYEGNMAPGEIDNTNKKRHSDALVYFYRGEVEYVFSDVSFTAVPGSVVFLPKNSSYRMIIREHSDYYVIDFEFEASEKIRRGECFKRLSPAVQIDFEKLFHTWHKSETWSFADSYSQIYRIYSVCLHSNSAEYRKAGEIYSKAIKFLLDNYTCSDISSSSIAAHAGVTETHLRRIFKAKVGTPPMHYVNYLRIEKAKNLLTSSNCSVGEIARLSGFADQYYFSREFKKRTGTTPTAYKSAGARNIKLK